MGEELLLINFKTIRCTSKNLCILFKTGHLCQLGCTDSPRCKWLRIEVFFCNFPTEFLHGSSSDFSCLMNFLGRENILLLNPPQHAIKSVYYTMADPGFPVGGHRPSTRVLFGKNVCENERIGSRWRGRRRHPPDPPKVYLTHDTNYFRHAQKNRQSLHMYIDWKPLVH